MAQKVDLAAKLVHAVLQCGTHELYETLRIGRDASREAIQHGASEPSELAGGERPRGYV